MAESLDIKKLALKIEKIKKATLELKEISGQTPCIDKNADRILASVKMLEIDISDVAEFY